MRRQIDEQKRIVWEQRLARFRASGLTIAKFCQRENVALHTFYYWAKQIASPGPAKLPRQRTERPVASGAGGPLRHEQSGGAQSVFRNGHTRSPSAFTPAGENVAMVHFDFHHGARLAIPADCLETIRCVVQCVEQSGGSQGTAFREVLLSH